MYLTVRQTGKSIEEFGNVACNDIVLEIVSMHEYAGSKRGSTDTFTETVDHRVSLTGILYQWRVYGYNWLGWSYFTAEVGGPQNGLGAGLPYGIDQVAPILL